jgi:HlyD family secretion protein
MKNWQIIVLVLLAVLFIAGAGYLGVRIAQPRGEATAAATPVTVAVTKGDVNQTITAPGDLLWTDIINLYMDAGGSVAEINVRPGDWVEAGEVLARLDDADAQVEVDQAEIALRQAELQLAQLIEDPTAADQASAQASLAAAQADLDELTTPPTAEELAEAREGLVSAQQALEELLAGLKPEEITIAAADLEQATIALQDAQAAYDKIAWQSDIGAAPEGRALWQATTAYERAKASYKLAVASPTEEQLAAARARIAGAQAQVDTLERGPDPEDVTAVQANVTQAEAALDDLLAGASASDVEMAELNIARAQLNLGTACEELESGVLTAPEDGIVLDVSVSEGQRVDKGTNAVRMADPNELELYATIIEEDYTITEVGQTVQVYFDAMPDQAVLGRIARIVPEKIPGERPLYAIYIELEEIPAGLAEGMTADAEIIIDSRDGVLRLPRSLVKARSDGSAQILLWTNNQEVERTVQTGLRGDVYIEILDGLNEGDLVVGK